MLAYPWMNKTHRIYSIKSLIGLKNFVENERWRKCIDEPWNGSCNATWSSIKISGYIVFITPLDNHSI